MNKKLITLCMSSLILGACSSSPKQQANTADQQSMYMLVGSYSDADKEGIKVYRFNAETGDAEYVSGLKGISNPSYLTPSANGERIYSVGEDEGETSTAHAIGFDKEKGCLTLMNSLPTHGGSPCYIRLSPSEKSVITANYMGGSITIFSLDEKGNLKPDSKLITFTGNGPNKERQSQPHLHCVEFTPDHRFLLANDLGTDRIHVFPFHETSHEGTPASQQVDEAEMQEVEVNGGSGPRHICFHPNGKFAYLINELSGQVTAFSYNQGRLETLQYIEADTVGAQGSGDIHISPDGRFLYASNRLQADGLAIFSVDSVRGTLARTGYQSTGIHPRNFIITPNGRYLLVACRDSNSIQVFERDLHTGLLRNTGKTIQTDKPVCLKFIQEKKMQ